MKFTVFSFVGLFAVIGAAYVFASSAAQPTVSGTITLRPDSTLVYGGVLKVDAVVAGKLSPRGHSYIRTICRDPLQSLYGSSLIVYQWSKDVTEGMAEGFSLIDQEGQNLQWDGQSVMCEAELLYQIEGSRNTTLLTLASTGEFSVASRQ